MLQLTRTRNLLFLLPAALIAACIFLTYSELFLEETSVLSSAITFDLLITTPIIYYLIIRKRSIPKTTIVPVFILGIVVASIILPQAHQGYLELAKTWLLPLLELGVFTYLVVMIRKGIRVAKQEKNTSLDFHDLTRIAAAKILNPRLGTLLATELSMLYYGLINWKKYQPKADEYTYHRSTSTRMLLGVIIFLVVIETVAVHIALQTWSAVAAWILTAISAYTALQLLAIAKSISRRPILVGEDKLKLRWGFMHETEIHYENIASIELEKKEGAKAPGICFLSPFQSAEGHNVKIVLHEEQALTKLYGFTSGYTEIFVYLDDPESFISSIKQRENPTSTIH